MPVYMITVKLFNSKEKTWVRFYKEDIDLVYCVVRKWANFKFGHNQIYIYNCVMLSNHDRDALFCIARMEKEVAWKSRSVYRVLEGIPKGKL